MHYVHFYSRRIVVFKNFENIFEKFENIFEKFGNTSENLKIFLKNSKTFLKNLKIFLKIWKYFFKYWNYYQNYPKIIVKTKKSASNGLKSGDGYARTHTPLYIYRWPHVLIWYDKIMPEDHYIPYHMYYIYTFFLCAFS